MNDDTLMKPRILQNKRLAHQNNRNIAPQNRTGPVQNVIQTEKTDDE
jgi:hypothetical protein